MASMYVLGLLNEMHCTAEDGAGMQSRADLPQVLDVSGDIKWHHHFKILFIKHLHTPYFL